MHWVLKLFIISYLQVAKGREGKVIMKILIECQKYSLHLLKLYNYENAAFEISN